MGAVVEGSHVGRATRLHCLGVDQALEGRARIVGGEPEGHLAAATERIGRLIDRGLGRIGVDRRVDPRVGSRIGRDLLFVGDVARTGAGNHESRGEHAGPACLIWRSHQNLPFRERPAWWAPAIGVTTTVSCGAPISHSTTALASAPPPAM